MHMPIGLAGQGGGVGHPDAMTGHGYFSAKGGALNKTRSMGRGYPYDELDLEPDEEYDDEDDDELDDEAVRVAKETGTNWSSSAGDPYSMNRRDRKSYTSSNSFGLPNVPVFAEAREELRTELNNQRCRLHELSATIRLRSRSSEPDSGTIYGWSSPPQWNEPPRFGGIDNPRYLDVVGEDEEEEFEDKRRQVRNDVYEEQLIRRLIRQCMQTMCYR